MTEATLWKEATASSKVSTGAVLPAFYPDLLRLLVRLFSTKGAKRKFEEDDDGFEMYDWALWETAESSSRAIGSSSNAVGGVYGVSIAVVSLVPVFPVPSRHSASVST